MNYRAIGGLLALLAIVALLVFAPRTAAAPSVTFECADPSGLPTTGCVVLLDPDIHGGSKGTILFTATTAGKRTISLPDGAHRVAVVALAKGSTGTNTAVLVMQTAPTGCASGWAPLGYQAWWSDTGQDPYFESRHAHIDNICWPVNNRILNGSQTFTFQVQLHNQPAGAKLTRIRLKDYPGGTDRWVCTPSRRDAGCPTGTWPVIDAGGNLVIPAVSPTIDLSSLSSGRHEFRWGVYVTQPSGKVQLLSSRSEICIRSCSPAFRGGTFQGNGSWYQSDSIGYEDARIHTAFPVVP